MTSHRLTVTTNDAKDIRRNPTLRPFEAVCSCGKWRVGVHTREQYRVLHRVHLERLEGA